MFVRSSKYGKDEYTIPLDATQATWGTQANQLGGQVGQRFTLVCPPAGEISGRLWGSDLYTDDSSVCTAAAHSGLITVGGGGTVTIELRPGASSYRGTTRNGVTTKDFGAWPVSFVFVGQSGVRPTAFPKDEYYLAPFNGTWEAGSAWGDMVLTQNGNNVGGTYSVGGGGAIQGTASVGMLRFSWTRRDGGSPGEAFLTIKPDGSIEGRWCNGKGCDPSNGSPFTGRRKQ